MKRRPRALLLLLAVILPGAVLSAGGVTLLLRDAAGAGDRRQAQAESCARAAEAAVQQGAQRIATSAGALRFEVHPDGTLVSPAPRREAARDDTPLFALARVEREAEVLEAAGKTAEAVAAIRRFADVAPDGEALAKALTDLMAMEKQSGHASEALAAARELGRRCPEARDFRGLKRSFPARLQILDAEGAPVAALLDLWSDVLEDRRSAEDSATSLFASRLRARIAALIASGSAEESRFRDIETDDAKRRPERLLLAAFTKTAGRWIALGAPGGVVGVDVESLDDGRTLDRLIIGFDPAQPAAESELAGFALSEEHWQAQAEESPEVRAFGAFGLETGIVRRRESPPGGAVTLRPLAAPFDGFDVRVLAPGWPAQIASERRQFWMVASLAGLGVLMSLLAGVAILRAVARETAAVEARESFVAAVTHELKAPLASIRLMGELLARGGVEEAKVLEFGRRNVLESDRLARLVNSVLELARLERDGGDRAPHCFKVAGLLRCAESSVRPSLEARGFGLEIHDAESELAARGDEDALATVVVELIDNAAKYSDAPHAILLDAVERNGRVEISVSDRGRGIDRSLAARVFEPFVRGGDEMTRDRPGVGLGLALGRKVARASGGDVVHTPRPGGGSIMTLSLPRAEEDRP